jgi:oligopeptidase B
MSVPASLPPRPEPRPSSHIVHGVAIQDDFAWLRADNWQEVMRDPSRLPGDIRRYLEAENTYTETILRPTLDLQETLYREIRGRIKEDDSSVPSPDGAFAYASRHREGGQHPLLVRRPRAGGEETILIDGDARAAGHAYFRLAGGSHAPNHRYFGWSADDKGSEYFTIRVRDVEAGVDLADEIPETAGAAAWSADSQTLFYVQVDENHRPSRVMAHRLGTPTSEDRLIYEEADPGFFVGIGKTQSGRFITIDVHDHETSEVRLIAADDPSAVPVMIAARETGIEYEVDHGGDRLYIRTNANGARDFNRVQASSGAVGAGRGPAAHRHPSAGRWRRTRHRLRRGGLFARAARWLRVRYLCRALQLFLDDDTQPDI